MFCRLSLTESNPIELLWNYFEIPIRVTTLARASIEDQLKSTGYQITKTNYKHFVESLSHLL